MKYNNQKKKQNIKKAKANERFINNMKLHIENEQLKKREFKSFIDKSFSTVFKRDCRMFINIYLKL